MHTHFRNHRLLTHCTAALLFASAGASAAAAGLVTTTGAINGEYATLKDKIILLDPDNVLGKFDGVARAAVPVGSPVNAANRKTDSTGKLVGAVGNTGTATEAA